jgi:hypothetical protein
MLLTIWDPSVHLSNLEQVYHPENDDLMGHLKLSEHAQYCDTANIVSQAAKRRR